MAKYSKQRECILKIVLSSKEHYNANEIYLLARKEIPNISLGTVYRDLQQLAEAGQIRQLSFPGQRDCYDWKLNSHNHVCCQKCGKLVDFEVELDGLEEVISEQTGVQVNSYSLWATGICSDCAAKK